MSSGIPLKGKVSRNKYPELKKNSNKLEIFKLCLSVVMWRYIASAKARVGAGKPEVSFTKAGTLRNVELSIMNLRRGTQGSTSHKQWEKIGAWRSWDTDNHGLDIQDIVWPGESHVPPPGVPEKFHMTIGYLEEPPFINIARPDHVTNKCNVDRGIRCRTDNQTEWRCCSGFCIDLLAKMAEDLQFEFDLVRVEDPKWGTQVVRGY